MIRWHHGETASRLPARRGDRDLPRARPDRHGPAHRHDLRPAAAGDRDPRAALRPATRTTRRWRTTSSTRPPAPRLAHLGLRAARRYAQIALVAPHAQHMPSHIFVRLGLWDETVASNWKSYRAGSDRQGGRAGAARRRSCTRSTTRSTGTSSAARTRRHVRRLRWLTGVTPSNAAGSSHRTPDRDGREDPARAGRLGGGGGIPAAFGFAGSDRLRARPLHPARSGAPGAAAPMRPAPMRPAPRSAALDSIAKVLEARGSPTGAASCTSSATRPRPGARLAAGDTAGALALAKAATDGGGHRQTSGDGRPSCCRLASSRGTCSSRWGALRRLASHIGPRWPGNRAGRGVSLARPGPQSSPAIGRSCLGYRAFLRLMAKADPGRPEDRRGEAFARAAGPRSPGGKRGPMTTSSSPPTPERSIRAASTARVSCGP